MELRAGERVAKRFDAKMCEERVRTRVACMPKNGAESPRITQPENLRPDDEIHMVMGERWFRTRDDAKAARHAQMDDQRSRAAIDQQILCAAGYLRDQSANDRAMQVFGNRPPSY